MIDRVGQQLGNYQLLRRLGRGAFAEVYLGEHLYLERLAAIKVLHVQIEPKTQEQFRREARTIAHLQHPHIVQVLDFGLDDQTPYLVMEYTPGGTLLSQHPKGTCLSLEQIVTYVKQIASALDYAHQQRVIHRDVKPENMLFNTHHKVVLSDFGIAVVQQSMESLSLQPPAGTPLYMAPEQIQGRACAASDQYALAVVVYEWLCGQAPFGGSLFEVYSQHLYQAPPSLCSRVPHLPSMVEDAVLGALAKEPEHRFSSVQDFATVLEAACFATQPFVSRVFPEQETADPHASFATILASVTASRVGEADPTVEMTQPQLIPSEQTRAEQKPEQLMIVPPDAESQTSPKQANLSPMQNNRERMLRKVRAFWIEGVLSHSLHGTALITLGLQEQLEALTNPWNLVLQHPDTAPRALSPGTRITDAYDAANGELLILGAPGSGKTTLLLELARDLLDRAEQDEQYLMPVIFNLSSWAAKQMRLTDWIVEELIDKYDVPRKLARAWIDTNQILPLLDGLDEVTIDKRTACIKTTNIYHQEHAFLPLVVCSRSADYLAQTERVRLTSAVTIQSLTQQQVDDYLASGGESLWALRVALHQDAALRELTETPLMLGILTLTYHDIPVEELLQGGIAPTRQQVFKHYIERMLRHRGAAMRYTQEQTTHWLSWLARQLAQHSQTVFFIERMQPDWLSRPKLHQAYDRTVRLGIGVISGIIIFLSIGTAVALFVGIGLGLQTGLISGLIIGSISGLFGGLAIGVTSQIETEIHPAEVINWSWRKLVAMRTLKGRLRVGLSSSLLVSLIVGVGLNVPKIDFSVLLVVLLVTAVLITVSIVVSSGLTSGVSSSIQDERYFTLPNQGIRRSARNSIRIGIIGGLIGGLISITPFALILLKGHAVFHAGFFSLLCFLLLCGSLGGTINSLVVGLANGGIACLQHFTLRFLLCRSRCLSWNYPRFLDYAAERILLCKVGGGYIFLHRFLLDYFVDLETGPKYDKSAESRQGILPPGAMSSMPVRPTAPDVLLDRIATPFAPISSTVFSESIHLLPCGHEQRSNARFCSICGASVPS